ncbi:MAG TPA: hypothetical protein VFU21_21885 [Kofleriaceae bacterium]|nr:hypothetical protein [Kofleriaceae bacterium]
MTPPVDFRSFLAPAEPVVLPYFGGSRVEAADRRLRVAAPVEPGWWRFRVDGRRATALEPADPVDLSDRPAVRGHHAAGWLFASGRDVHRIALPPAEEPAPLARVTGRVWHSGDLLFDTIDFEDEAEEAARRALEDGQGIGEVRGVPPSLRAAFGFALADAIGRALDIPISPREAGGRVQELAAGGRPAAEALLRALAEERRRHDAEARAREVRARVRERRGDPVDLADAALDAAGARMLSCRRIGGGNLEVRFQLDGERFVSIISGHSLQVLDAGICLSGADRQLTLDSLPSVIREAIETDRLNITRRW